MIQLFTYSIPFRRPFITAGERYENREGLLLTIKRKGITAYGEIAPLPGFSVESLEEVTPVVRDLISAHRSLFNDGAPLLIREVINQLELPSSVRYGLDMLTLDLMAKLNNCTITEVLGLNTTKHVYVNGVVGSGTHHEIIDQVANAELAGYKTLKFKVGRDHSAEKGLIAGVRDLYPDLAIRLDANQAWETQEAIEKLNDFAPFGVEYCEQPVSRYKPEALGNVKNRASVPVAADEAADGMDAVLRLIREDLCDVIIIKPMIFGSVDELIVTKSYADTHDKRIVFTTSLESVVGRTMVAELAAGLGSANMAHGLSTGELLTEKVVEAEVINGTYRSNRGPGIQVSPDLQYYRIVE